MVPNLQMMQKTPVNHEMLWLRQVKPQSADAYACNKMLVSAAHLHPLTEVRR
jgi:hypothetical protein